VVGSRGFTADDIRDVIDLYLEGAVRTEHLTRNVRPLEEGNEALEDLRSGRVLRSVLVP
jgi:Zn-dependent alcohol dehydrogenase